MTEPARRTSELLGWLGVAGLLAAALARSTSVQSPWRWFDVDPLRSPGALECLGASGGFLLDAAMLLSASLVLASLAWRGRRIDSGSLLLVLLPLPVLAWHARGDLEQAWRGSSLAAGWIALVAAAHLRQSPRLRIVLAAGVLAAAVPWLARAAEQWLVEIPASIRHFEVHRGEVLGSFGWSEGSEAALLYERRLVQREASAWFGLANVLSALLAAAGVAWVQMTLACRGRGLGGGTALLAAMIALAALAGVAVNGSKGAIAAAGAGLLVAATGAAWTRGGAVGAADHAAPWRLAGRAALLAVPLGVAAVVARGLLPEGFLGERSVLFRWQYLVGAAWAVLADPLRGFGPAGFQEVYLLVKPLRSPEAVQSAHSLVADSLVAVGVVGAAWLAALARVLGRRDDSSPAGEAPAGGAGAFVVALGVGLAATLWSEPSARSSEGVLRWIGLLLYLPAAVAARSILAAAGVARTAWILASVAFVLLLQGQIEMTFFAPGSIPIAMLAVGLAGGVASRPEADATPWVGRTMALLPALLAAVVMLGPFRESLWAEARLAEAAAPLDAVGRRIASGGEPLETQEIVGARRVAAMRLEAIAEAGGAAAGHAGSLAVAQWLDLAAAETAPAARRGAVESALRVADRALVDLGHSAGRLSDRLRAIRALREIDPDAVPAARIVEAILAALALRPHDVSLHADWGDAAADAGDVESARRAWRRALELDEALELDPLVQMPPSQRAAIKARIAETP